MGRHMIRVGEWAGVLSHKQRQLLRELADRGFSTIEASTHGNFTGDLPQWTLPGEVEIEMKDLGLNTDGVGIGRDTNYPNREGPRQKNRGKER